MVNTSRQGSAPAPANHRRAAGTGRRSPGPAPSSAANTAVSADDDGALPGAVTAWDGFEAFVTAPVAAPPPPGAPPRTLDERLAYHSRFVTVRTPVIDALARNVRTLMVLGRHQQVTARPSLIVTGAAAAGKTTALLQVGRVCHLAHARRHGRAAAGHVPVAYVLVPPAASAKTLAMEFARYLGIPVTDRMSQAQITNAVVHTYTAARVQLVMIDEIHRLNPRTTTGAPADLIKDLTERIAATFIYAGIDVTGTPLFTGVRGAQLAGHASLIDCGAFPARLGRHEPFHDLITAMENALDLHHHTPGTLPNLAGYLHQRTAGRIGSLARLIRQAAITALTDGTERITKTTLDTIRIDHLAEQHHRPPHPNPVHQRSVKRLRPSPHSAALPQRRGCSPLRPRQGCSAYGHSPHEATASYTHRLTTHHRLTLPPTPRRGRHHHPRPQRHPINAELILTPAAARHTSPPSPASAPPATTRPHASDKHKVNPPRAGA